MQRHCSWVEDEDGRIADHLTELAQVGLDAGNLEVAGELAMAADSLQTRPQGAMAPGFVAAVVGGPSKAAKSPRRPCKMRRLGTVGRRGRR
jgi:hypothetical protein